MQASRNGYFFVLDRTNGKSLLTVPFGPVNWAHGIDKQRPAHSQSRQGAGPGRRPDRTRRRRPHQLPLAQLRSQDRPVHRRRRTPARASTSPSPPTATYGWAGADYGLWGKGVLEAIDYQTGKIRWTHELGRRWRRVRRADHRLRPDLYRRRSRQLPRPRHRRPARPSGTPARAPTWPARPSPTSSTGSQICPD